MATVPISQGPTVEARPTNTTFQNAQFDPNAFGAGIGAATQGVGAALGKDANEMATVADHLAQQGALRAAKGADTAAEYGMSDLNNKFLPGGPDGNHGFYSLQGQAAVDAAPVYQKAIDDLHTQVGNTITDNPRAQTLFEVQSAQRKAAAYSAAGNYALHQSGVADDAASAGRVEAYTNTFTNTPNDPAALASYQQTVRGEASDYARRHGLPPDAAAAYTTSLLTKGYKDGILSLAAGNDVQGAAKLFQQVAPSMDAATRVSVAQHLEPMVTGSVADAWVKGQMNTALPAVPGSSSSIADAIHGQESGGKATSVDSIDGAKGGWQIMPATFKQYAQPGEDINVPGDNEAVGRRIIDDLSTKFGGDAKRVAVGYFSGPGNVSPAISADPWVQNKKDGNGKYTSQYVAEVMNRMHGAPQGPVGNATDANPAIHPDFASMADQATGQFADNPKLLAAVHARLGAAASQYNLSTQGDRDAIDHTWKDTLAAASGGMDTVSVDEAQIRHVFRPAVADAMMSQYHDAIEGGQVVSAAKLASPAGEESLRTSLDPRGADGDPVDYSRRLKLFTALTSALDQKHTALAKDPAAYAMQDPNVAAAFSAVDPKDPTTLQAAVAASQSSQRALGVAPGDERVLTNTQAASNVKQMHNITPEKGDMGAKLDALQAQYGPAYGDVIKDMVKAGLNPDYQMLAHANLPEQATVREDLQRALQNFDALKDKSEFGRAVPEDQKKLLQPAIDSALQPFRDTTKPYGDTSTYDSVVLPSVTKLATYYAGKGYSASDAVTQASKLVTDSYDFDGMLRTPKGQLSAVQDAGRTLQQGLNDADLRGTTAAEARRGTWVTSPDDGGTTLMKGTLQGGYMPVRRSDGSYVSMDFKNLPKASPVPMPELNGRVD